MVVESPRVFHVVAILLLVELILSRCDRYWNNWDARSRNPSFSGTYSLTYGQKN